MKRTHVGVLTAAALIGLAPSAFAADTSQESPSPAPSESVSLAPVVPVAPTTAAAAAHVSYVRETDSLVLKEADGIAELGALEPGQTCVVPVAGRNLGAAIPSVTLEALKTPLSATAATGPLSLPQVEVGAIGSCAVASNQGFLVRTYTFSVTPDATSPMGATYALKPAALGFFITIN